MGQFDAQSRRGNTSDFYVTPFPFVRALISNIDLSGKTILDPCCGTGVIGKVLEEFGLPYTGKDIITGDDFFNEKGSYDVIICNPPYSIKDDFLKKAFTVAERVYAILPMNVANYNSFHRDFMDIPSFYRKMLLTPKAFMSTEETETPKRGGISSYGWFTWFQKWEQDFSYEEYSDWTKFVKVTP